MGTGRCGARCGRNPYDHVARALKRPDIAEVLVKTGNEIVAMPPPEMLREAKLFHEYWSKIIPDLGVRVD